MNRKTRTTLITAMAFGLLGTAQAGPQIPTVQISGEVDVNNFPLVQEVEGTVSIDNLPGTQTVDGSVAVTNDASNPVPVSIVGGGSAGEYVFYSVSDANGDELQILIPEGKVFQIKGFYLRMQGLIGDPRPDGRYNWRVKFTLPGGDESYLEFFSGSECAHFINNECRGTITQQLDAFPPITGLKFLGTGFVPSGSYSWRDVFDAKVWGVLMDAPLQ